MYIKLSKKENIELQAKYPENKQVTWINLIKDVSGIKGNDSTYIVIMNKFLYNWQNLRTGEYW